MKRIIDRLIFFVLLVVGIMVGMYFLYIDKFGSVGFNVYISILIISGFAFYGFDRLKEIDLKNLKLVLTEMKQTKTQVFAKVEEVKRIMKDLAYSYIDSAIESGRIIRGRHNLHKQMVRKRRTAKELLTKVGWEEGRIQEKTARIDELIAGDLIRDIEETAYRILKKRRKDTRIRQLGEIDPEFANLVTESTSNEKIIGRIKAYLRSHQIPLESFQEQLEELDYFFHHKEIKQ